MTRQKTRIAKLAMAVSLVSVLPALGETAPADVVYDEGAVAASLSDAPGNADEGMKVMTTAALGQLRGLPRDRDDAECPVPRQYRAAAGWGG